MPASGAAAPLPAKKFETVAFDPLVMPTRGGQLVPHEGRLNMLAARPPWRHHQTGSQRPSASWSTSLPALSLARAPVGIMASTIGAAESAPGKATPHPNDALLGRMPAFDTSASLPAKKLHVATFNPSRHSLAIGTPFPHEGHLYYLPQPYGSVVLLLASPLRAVWALPLLRRCLGCRRGNGVVVGRAIRVGGLGTALVVLLVLAFARDLRNLIGVFDLTWLRFVRTGGRLGALAWPSLSLPCAGLAVALGSGAAVGAVSAERGAATRLTGAGIVESLRLLGAVEMIAVPGGSVTAPLVRRGRLPLQL